jgi:excisionase family DNA binding protein
VLTSGETYLTVGEAATELRCSESHIRNLIRGLVRNVPALPSMRLGRRIVIRKSSLHQWAQQRERLGTGRLFAIQ